MNEKNGSHGKQRKAAPSKQARSKRNNKTNTPFNIETLNGAAELKPHWIITPLLLLSAAAPFLPRAAAARSVMNNNTSVPEGDRLLSSADRPTHSTVSVVNPSQTPPPPPRFVEQALPIISMQSAVSNKKNIAEINLYSADVVDSSNQFESLHQSTQELQTKHAVSPIKSKKDLDTPLVDNSHQLEFMHVLMEGSYHEAERIILAGKAGSLNNEFDANGTKHSYMELAAISGRIDRVKLLQKHGADINALASNGYTTPLSGVIYATNPPLPVSFIQEMIELGASPHFELPNKVNNKPGILIANPVLNAILSRQRLDILKLFLAKKYISLENAFYYALVFPHRDTVDYLINKGINLYAKKPDGSTYLHLAVKNNLDNVKHILEFAPNLINVGDNKGDMPLHVAAARNELEMVQLLLKAGAHPGLKNRSARTAAELTISQEIKKVLLTSTNALLASTKADSQKQTAHLPKLWSRTAGNYNAPLKQNPFGDNAGSTNLFNSDNQLAELPATDCHMSGRFTIEEHEQRYCVIYLTEPSIVNWNAAVRKGVRALLIPNRLELFKIVNMWNKDQREKLITAIEDAASQQVGHGVNYPYADYINPATYDSSNRPHILIKSDLLVLKQDQSNFTDAIVAKDRKTFDEIITNRKVDITESIKEKNGDILSILQLCCSSFGDAYFVEKLLSLGVDVNEVYSGNTALHYAIKYGGSIDTIKILLKYDADPLLLDANGETAIALAKKTGNRQLLKLLSPTTYADSSSPISSKQKITAYFEEAIKFVCAYPYEITLASALLLVLGFLWWMKKNRDNDLKIKQSHILKHEEYLQKIAQTFFNVEKLSEFKTVIGMRLTSRSSQELQQVIREHYQSLIRIPVINIEPRLLIDHYIKVISQFYGSNAVKWVDNVLSVDVTAVLRQMPPEIKKAELTQFVKTTVEKSPEYLELKTTTELIDSHKAKLALADKSKNRFLTELQAYRDYMKDKMITIDMLDNCKTAVGKAATKVRDIKSAMSVIHKIDEEYKKYKDEKDKMYAANSLLQPENTASVIKQKTAALEALQDYYVSKSDLLAKQYDAKFVENVAEFTKNNKALFLDKKSSVLQERNKDENKAEKRDDESEAESNHNEDEIVQDHEEQDQQDLEEQNQEEQMDDSNQHNLQLKPPALSLVDQMPASSVIVQLPSPIPVIQQPPSPASVVNQRKKGNIEIIIHNRNSLFPPALPAPKLSTEESAPVSKMRHFKAPQQAEPISAADLEIKIKDHALGLSVLVATASEYNFELEGVRILYRNALFYHLLRFFHGMWLLKLGNPDEFINFTQVQKMRNLLAYHSTNISQDGLFIYASEIRNKLFPDTDIVGTKEQLEKIKQQFRDRLSKIDIKQTDLFRALQREKEQSAQTESSCYNKIVKGFQEAQSIFNDKSVDLERSGHIFHANPDLSAAIKALLAIIGDNFMQIRDYYPESWERLASQFGRDYFDNFIKFRKRIFHQFTGAVDINNSDLYHQTRIFLRGDHVEKMLEEMKKDSSHYSLSPPKA